MHYYRLRRTGTTDRLETTAQPALEHEQGYLLEYAPGHPLATPGHPHVYEHRKVFYDEKGKGPFSCHVCDEVVTWADLHVDHLDDVRHHNKIENLAPACATCNQARGRHKMIATQRAQGRQITAFGKTQCISVWVAGLTISHSTLRRRLAAGWDAEKAIQTPSGPSGPKKTALERTRRLHERPEIAEEGDERAIEGRGIGAGPVAERAKVTRGARRPTGGGDLDG
jgi:5-methylcytosine-specific restriction endonuclease McrA